MGQLLLDGVPIGVPDRSVTAAGVSYDNTQSGLSATDVQGAVDEVAARTNILTSSQAIVANNTNVAMPLSENLNTNYMYIVKYKDFQNFDNSFIFVPNGTTAKVLIQTLYANTVASKAQLLIMNKNWNMTLFDGSTDANKSITITSVTKVRY